MFGSVCLEPYLESRHNVALGGVAQSLGHAIHFEVTDERVQCHSSANNGSIVPHCHHDQIFAVELNFSLYLLARADMEAISAMTWMRQLRTSGGSSVPVA